MITTYSMWNRFLQCRKACDYRYNQHLVPLQVNPTLNFGRVIHECLDVWHSLRDEGYAWPIIEREIESGYPEENQKHHKQLALAMMAGYLRRYPSEIFTVIATEDEFHLPIINPETGAKSQAFTLAGKVDGVVEIDGKLYLLEHKTASSIDSNYLERLWVDFQTQLYCIYEGEKLGRPISGIIYNVLAKAKIKQGKGETEEEFRDRREMLIAKSRSGKTTAKRKMPESDEDFEHRLREWYDKPEAFHREELFVDKHSLQVIREEIWELCQAFLEAQRRGKFYRNTSQCFQFNRPCDYFPICKSGGSSIVIENLFRKEEPHSELSLKPKEGKEGKEEEKENANDEWVPF